MLTLFHDFESKFEALVFASSVWLELNHHVWTSRKQWELPIHTAGISAQKTIRLLRLLQERHYFLIICKHITERKIRLSKDRVTEPFIRRPGCITNGVSGDITENRFVVRKIITKKIFTNFPIVFPGKAVSPSERVNVSPSLRLRLVIVTLTRFPRGALIFQVQSLFAG